MDCWCGGSRIVNELNWFDLGGSYKIGLESAVRFPQRRHSIHLLTIAGCLACSLVIVNTAVVVWFPVIVLLRSNSSSLIPCLRAVSCFVSAAQLTLLLIDLELDMRLRYCMYFIC